MGDDLLDGTMMDLDLNHEPSDPPSGSDLVFGSILNGSETAGYGIEERIRRLEAVTARVRERNRWRHQARNSVDLNNLLVNPNFSGGSSMGTMGMTFVPGRGCKRDSSHLVAKALEMDSKIRRVDKDGCGFFDCNICLEMAQDPVLTCCGHLFCWMCFFWVPYVYSTTKECPVCRGEVSDNNVTPIYGNGNGPNEKESEPGLKIPPRPKANRIESARQQPVSRSLSHVPAAEVLRRIRAFIGMDEEPPQPQQPSGSRDSQNLNITGPEAPHALVRVLSESSASLSSLLDNSQRFQQRSSALGLSIGDMSEHRALDSTTEIDSPAPIHSPSQATDVSDAAAQLENLTTASPTRALHSSPSFRRRFSFLRLSDIDSVVSRETRRRRLS